MSTTSLDYNGLMQANLTRVFGERDASRRTKAITERYANDATLYEPDAEAKGHAAINRAVEALLSHMPPLSGHQTRRAASVKFGAPKNTPAEISRDQPLLQELIAWDHRHDQATRRIDD